MTPNTLNMRLSSLFLVAAPSLLAACGGSFEDYYSGTAPTISSISVDSEIGSVGGQTAIISGSGFGEELDGLTVIFGYSNAEIQAVTDGEITVTVPRGPLEAGAVDIKVGTVGGQAIFEDGYTFDASSGGVIFDEGDSDDFYANQVAYLALDNDWLSCYAGIGLDDLLNLDSNGIEFCEESAWVGQTGQGGQAEFWDFAFPRVHTMWAGARGGYGGSSDWSWGEWAVEIPPQDYIDVDIDDAYEDRRVEIDSFSIRNPRLDDEDFHADMSVLGTYRYAGGDEAEDGSILGPYTVVPVNTLRDEASEDDAWAKTYERGRMNYCQAPEYDTPRSYRYESDYPVGKDFFIGRSEEDGIDGPVTLELDIPDVGINGQELIFPNYSQFLATKGSAYEDLWALVGIGANSCPDEGDEGVADLDSPVVTWEWEPYDGDYASGGGITGARTYVRVTLNILSFGWFGGEGAPIRAVITVPDDHNYDEDTGRSSVSVPASVLYQFPYSSFDVGIEYDNITGDPVGFNWGDPSVTEYGYFVAVVERVTEYKVEAGYSTTSDVDVDGEIIVASASGDLGFSFWENPLNLDGCNNCQDDDGDGWADRDDPDCEDSDSEDGSAFGVYTCNDGEDNDGDGATDADDEDCLTGEDGETNCFDGEDNDGDGFTDEEDGECAETGFELGEDDPDWQCGNGEDDDGDTWIDLEDPDCSSSADDELGLGDTECNDGEDNDGHGDVDSEDLTCARQGADYESEQPNFSADCIDETDNDDDGLVDGNDPDCETPPFAYENGDGFEDGEWPVTPICYNSQDDDGDGFIDWMDAGCVNEAGELDGFVGDEDADLPGYTTCADGEDNDGDGWADDADPGCEDDTLPEDDGYGTTQCNDNLDNDADGKRDEDDEQCEDGYDDDEEN